MSLSDGYGHGRGHVSTRAEDQEDVYRAKSRRRASEYYEPPAAGSGSVRGWWQKLRERRDSEAAAAAAKAGSEAVKEAEGAGAVEEAVESESETETAKQEEEGKKEEGKKALTQADLHSIFKGAPYFFLEKGDYGQWFPLVIYPYSETDNSVQNMWDRRPLSHGSFSLCTLHAHIPVPDGWVVYGDEPGQLTTTGCRGREPSKRAAFDVGIFEVPNMLDANGKVNGTVGVQYFLEMPISDIARYGIAERSRSTIPCMEDNHHKENNDTAEAEAKPEAYAYCSRTVDRKTLLDEGPDAWARIGVRDVSVADLSSRLERLRKVRSDVLYNVVHKTILDVESPRTLHDTLFCRLLHYPPASILDDENPLSVKCQIRLLTTVLATEGAWVDFSLEEWRLRAGRILWQSHHKNPSEEQECRADGEEEGEEEEERRWLLIQMLLAGELLLRVDGLVHAGLQSSHIGASGAEIGEFDRLRDRKVNWDLIVVRRLFDCMRVEEDAGRCTLIPLRMRPQMHGLLVFAEQIGWPDVSGLQERLSTIDENDFRHSVPRRNNTQTQPADVQTNATRRIVALHNGPGWITRSWLSGFIIPGDSITHLLLCSVLENDPQAQSTLGPLANLRGGFSYHGHSWWNKHCVVGKVIAGLTESEPGAPHESMGWMRSDLVPRETATAKPLDDRWFELRVKEPPAGLAWTKPRIKHANQVARQSTPLGSGYIAREAFSLPLDQPPCDTQVELADPAGLLTFVSCSRAPADDEGLIDSVVLVQQPALAFQITSPGSDTKKISWPLTYNVQFIAGYDCQPPRGRIRRRSADTLGTTTTSTTTSRGGPGQGRVPGHPLHSVYAYRRVSVGDLLREDSGSSSMLGNSNVLVVNARGSAVKATFARAWCASMGRNAVIARVGRTCVACSIREARAMNVDVVIREDSGNGRSVHRQCP